ncbi:endonuclease/exonuclease/phosphatase family protein [Parapedobacter tibetensis]|uniref:endonuclease/exonuclease/phosphatase family protein n=1 Tax=Parapedobacter tibetensis TaxID=2972951 RepID=UPI00214DCD31|nr:endonuclease/exonuclease/phosphatase family protein [Parapedobacter tibetensis]
MPKITDTPPQEIREEFNVLAADLDERIPAKKLDKNILICTWNIRAFGGLTEEWEATDSQSPKRDLHSLLCIVEVLKRFDIIAVQEVKGELKALRHALKLLGPHWSFLMTDVTKGNPGNDERLAFLFDSRKVKLSGLACEIVIPDDVLHANKAIGNHALERQFARTPYGVSFLAGGKTFVLLTLHVLYGTSASRIPELRAIAEWIRDWADDLHKWNHSLITLGDFNIVKAGDPTYEAFISRGLHVPDDLQDIDRTVFKKAYSFYDQIAWFDGELSMVYGRGGVYDFRDKLLLSRNYPESQLSWRISDHFPLWAEFLT